MSKRMDGEDTVDSAVHFLQHLQAEGWAVRRSEHTVSYAEVGKRRIPTAATLTIELIPVRA